jgi:hypothetical protein
MSCISVIQGAQNMFRNNSKTNQTYNSLGEFYQHIAIGANFGNHLKKM